MNIDRINTRITSNTSATNRTTPAQTDAKPVQITDEFAGSASPSLQKIDLQSAGIGKAAAGNAANAIFEKLESKVEKNWEYDLQPTDKLINCEPLIRDDGIFVNIGGYTTKLDLDGKEVFRVETGVSGYSQPAFDSKGNIYVSNSDNGHELVSLDPTGKERFRVSTGERGCSHTPVITSDDKICLCTDGREVRIYDDTGKCTWSAKNDRIMSRKPFLDKNGILHITETYNDRKFQNSHFIVNTRKPSLRKKENFDSLKNMLIDEDGNNYVFDEGKFRAKDINGKEKWAMDLPGETTSSEALIGPDGKMYIRVREHAILCVDPKDGKENWRLEGQDPHETLSGDYAWAKDGTFYTTGSGGNWKLYSVKPDGSARWTNKDNEHIGKVKVGADGTIFTGGEHYPIKSFDPVTGKKQWTTDFKLSFGDDNYKVLDGNRILATTEDGKLVSLEYTTKEQQLKETAEKLSSESESTPAAPKIEETAEWVEIGGVRLKKNK